MYAIRQSQVRHSSIWAAYGDAVGFVTELADEDRVLHRAGEFPIRGTLGWRRKVGGRIGLTVDFPAGAYSDDTQLRLATSRAIRGDGSFDVAAFAKVELPAWANYALGAGVGSKEAAANLSRTSATWYSNFFKNQRASYFSGGGNGAAMRIQPHVWVAKNLEDLPTILKDVIRNAVCTHGHPRGIVGACFHAASLARAMFTGVAPALDDCAKLILRLGSINEIVDDDTDLRLLWRGSWEDQVGSSFSKSVDTVLRELQEDLEKLSIINLADANYAYNEAVDKLDLKNPISRGSGTKTSLLASFAAQLNDHDPYQTIQTIVNCLGSDTDTIATMAGAIIGSVSSKECKDDLQDRDYIESEATRLSLISSGKAQHSSLYPDLRSWKPARTALDAVSIQNGELNLNGIGPLSPLSRKVEQRSKDENLHWFKLPFGQTVLARVREEPLKNSGWQRSGSDRHPDRAEEPGGVVSRLPDLFANSPDKVGVAEAREIQKPNANSLNETLHKVIASGFDPKLIGEVLLSQVRSGRPDFVEQSIALTATIMTAYEARRRRGK